MNFPENSCLVVVDLQKDFLDKGGYYFSSGKDISPILESYYYIQSLIKFAFGKVSIIWVFSEYEPEKFGKGKSICVKGKMGSEPMLEEKMAGAIFKKTEYSAFSNPEFSLFLKEHKIGTIILAGVTTENCIKATAIDAIKRGFSVLIHEDCVATNKERKNLHDDAIRQMKELGVSFISLARN